MAGREPATSRASGDNPTRSAHKPPLFLIREDKGWTWEVGLF